MKQTEIEMDLSNKSIKNTIRYLNTLKNRLKNDMSDATHQVANKIEEIASSTYKFAEMNIPVNQRFEPDKVDVNFYTVDETGDSSTLVAGGDAVWSEFGAGVHFNANDAHEWRADAEGIVGIGEYGNKHGSQDSWRYPADLGGTTVMARTYGTPQTLALYNATMQVKADTQETARYVREVLDIE